MKIVKVNAIHFPGTGIFTLANTGDAFSLT